MDWLEQNLDAYRIIAEILDDLRETVRERLGQLHGNEWYQSGLPEGLLDRLVERKEKEKAIDWYESEYQQIMNYAMFRDILEILEHTPEAFPQITGLAPTSTLLNARFLELEVMRAKLGRARPISETELSFLGTFHLRFRKAIEDYRTRQGAGAEPASAQATPPPEAQPNAQAAPRPPAVEPVKPPPPEPQPFPESTTPVEPVKAPDDSPTDEVFEPPKEEPTPVASPDTQGTAAPAVETPPTPTPEPRPASPEPAEVDPQELSFEDALDAGDSQIILRELYKEVTGIAEGIWTKDIPPPARVWEMVSVSDWYENSFSELGMRPASDFYDIISKVDRRMREGSTKDQLQDYLKESNFAQILLALRDMFQKNHI